MVDAMANSVEDYLIEGQNLKIIPGASYVNRSPKRFFFL